MSAYKIGDVKGGRTLRRKRGTVELWETQSGRYVVYLRITAEEVLWAVRRSRKDADVLFENVCKMFPNLEPEMSHRMGYSPLRLIPPSE